MHASTTEKQAGRTAPGNGAATLRHVLVVDDEESLRHMLVVLLKREGYEATAVGSGEQALAELDAALATTWCSRTSACPSSAGSSSSTRSTSANLPTTVILMSAFGNVDVAIEAMKRGAYDYVSKPFRPDEVVLVLQEGRGARAAASRERRAQAAAGARERATTTAAACRR